MKRGYRETVEPTIEGLEELDESTRYATIDRLIAAVSNKRLKPDKLMDLTQHFRKRLSVEEKELYRLGEMSLGYNRKWATNHNRCFDNAQIVLDKRQSQYKSWREILKFTTPRYKSAPFDAENPQSTYQKSFLTHQPYERDMWGPASYGRLVQDLWDTIETTIQHMGEGKELCNDMIAKESEIDNDPKLKEELFWDQYDTEAERNKDVIELYVRNGNVDTENPEYQRMLSFTDTYTGFAVADFHKRTETGFSGFVVVNETLARQNQKITHIESMLFGRKFERIERVRFLIDHLEELLSVKGQRFDKVDTMTFIKWCHVKKIEKRNDNERVLFNYIVARRNEPLRFYSWSTLFGLRKDMKESEDVWKRPVAALNKKAKELWESYHDEPWEPQKLNG